MDNVEVVRKVEEAYANKDYDTVRSLIDPDMIGHTPGSEMMPKGVEGCIAADEGGWSYFPDKKVELLEVFGEGDKVVARMRFTGTNLGGLDWAGIAPSDNKIDIECLQISRHDGEGRIVETWAQMDIPKMMVQDRKSTRLNSSHSRASRMPSSA